MILGGSLIIFSLPLPLTLERYLTEGMGPEKRNEVKFIFWNLGTALYIQVCFLFALSTFLDHKKSI